MDDLAKLFEQLKAGGEAAQEVAQMPSTEDVMRIALVLALHRADWKSLHLVWKPAFELIIKAINASDVPMDLWILREVFQECLLYDKHS